MAILPREASYPEFCTYVIDLKGSRTEAELAALWEWRQKVLSINVDTKSGWRGAALAPDEQHLSRCEVGKKRHQDAVGQGRHVERLPDKAMF